MDCGVDPYLNYTAYGCVFDAFARGTSAFAYFIPPPEHVAQALVAQVNGGVYVFKYLSSVPPEGQRGERVRLEEISCLDPQLEQADGHAEALGPFACSEVVRIVE